MFFQAEILSIYSFRLKFCLYILLGSNCVYIFFWLKLCLYILLGSNFVYIFFQAQILAQCHFSRFKFILRNPKLKFSGSKFILRNPKLKFSGSRFLFKNDKLKFSGSRFLLRNYKLRFSGSRFILRNARFRIICPFSVRRKILQSFIKANFNKIQFYILQGFIIILIKNPINSTNTDGEREGGGWRKSNLKI